MHRLTISSCRWRRIEHKQSLADLTTDEQGHSFDEQMPYNKFLQASSINVIFSVWVCCLVLYQWLVDVFCFVSFGVLSDHHLTMIYDSDRWAGRVISLSISWWAVWNDNMTGGDRCSTQLTLFEQIMQSHNYACNARWPFLFWTRQRNRVYPLWVNSVCIPGRWQHINLAIWTACDLSEDMPENLSNQSASSYKF